MQEAMQSAYSIVHGFLYCLCALYSPYSVQSILWTEYSYSTPVLHSLSIVVVRSVIMLYMCDIDCLLCPATLLCLYY